MRIVISNPDGIGDAVLRLPMFEALRDAGHELLLICREHSGALLRRLGQEKGGISVATFPENPYPLTRNNGKVMDFNPAIFEEARRFRPELLVFASYQWTIFEEALALALRGVPRMRMNGHRFEYLTNVGIPLTDGNTEQIVQVEEFSREERKNQALCSAIGGREVTLGDPVIKVAPEDVSAGRACLMEGFGGEVPENLWIGCMGTPGDFYGNIRDWGFENWQEILTHLVEEQRAAFVLIGNELERASLEKLRGPNDVAKKILVATGDAGKTEDLSRLLGLISFARAYLGKDTGPMHLAAAIGKPVVAVFGGGYWPRFMPMVTPSFAMTMALPCSPCEWECHMPESLCVKRVPVNMVKAAVDAIASGTANGREMMRIAPTPELLQAARRR